MTSQRRERWHDAERGPSSTFGMMRSLKLREAAWTATNEKRFKMRRIASRPTLDEDILIAQRGNGSLVVPLERVESILSVDGPLLCG